MAGAAAAIRKMAQSPLYSGKTMQDLIGTWVGHGESYAPIIEKMTGIPRNTKITPEFLASDDGIKFLKAMARYETKQSEPYHLTDAQWRQARDVALGRAPAAAAGAAPSSVGSAIDRYSSRRLDQMIGGHSNVTGSVNLTVNSNGTRAMTKADADGIFQKTKVVNARQMQPTDSPAQRLAEGTAAL
jgi:hypothetical protein